MYIEKIAKKALGIPLVRNVINWYEVLGVNAMGGGKYRISNPLVIGSYKNLYLHNNAEINSNCFLLAKDRIEIGENSTLAYGVTILTSANPNGPGNKLSELYPKMTAPVIIGAYVWVGANATILLGVNIGDFSIVAAGADDKKPFFKQYSNWVLSKLLLRKDEQY